MSKKESRLQKGGRRDKMDFVASLLKKEKSRKEIIEELLKQYKGMSENYASTVIQLTRGELGMTGRKASKKVKSGSTKKAEKRVSKKAEKKASKKEDEKPAKKSAFLDW